MRNFIVILAVSFAALMLSQACTPDSNSEITPDTPPVIGDNTGGNDGNGSGNGKYDFEIFVGFDLFDAYYVEEEGRYMYVIFVGFGVPAGVLDMGINEFGLEVRTSDGNIQNKNGWDGDVRVSRNDSWVYLSGLIMSDNAYTWSTTIIVSSEMSHIELSYRWKLFDNELGKYVTAPYTFDGSESFYAE